MVKVTSFIFEIAEFLASDPERLKFTESGPSSDLSRQMRRRGLTLGIMPDFAGNIKNGLRADLVTPGRPADLGGMKKGDIITAINGKRITNIQDYMFRMGQLEKGQTINVDVLRDSTKILLLIQL
jgi:S1-C subfamily serine protease